VTDLLFRTDAYLREAEGRVAGLTPEGGIILDRSVFYPTAGGQPGDSGRIDWAGGTLPVATAVKGEGGTVVLIPAEARDLPRPGDLLRQTIDWDRRHRHMRVHTALHLLSVVVPLPVTGGQIGTDRGRLDFDMPEPPADVAGIDAALNALIARDLPVTDAWITDDELLANPSLVKTMSVMPPMGQGRVRLVRIGQGEDQVDLQPCGGTHVARTGEIGRVTLGKIEYKGRQNRRMSIHLCG
jgi:misacylated tRNA(Ala) deacylase